MRLALVVIARDEAPRIGRLLRSVAPWVDDMVVLDTGSTDETVPLAVALGAKVHSFKWCEDFSAARNAALDIAAADWHLVLDADEWLIDGGPALLELRQRLPEFVGLFRLDDHGAEGGVVRHWMSRVLPGAVRYEGRIHEQPAHRLATRRLPLIVGHDGYAPERLAAKRGRNRRLLQAEIAAAPLDAYLQYQLGKDHAVYDEHAQAVKAFEQAEARMLQMAPWLCDLVTRHLFSLKKAGCHAEAMAVAERHLVDCADSPDFFFALGDVLLDWTAECPAQAQTLLPMALDAWQRCMDIGERPDLPGSVSGRGSYLAAHNLAVVHEGLGRVDIARDLRQRHARPAPGRVASGQDA